MLGLDSDCVLSATRGPLVWPSQQGSKERFVGRMGDRTRVHHLGHAYAPRLVCTRLPARQGANDAVARSGDRSHLLQQPASCFWLAELLTLPRF